MPPSKAVNACIQVDDNTYLGLSEWATENVFASLAIMQVPTTWTSYATFSYSADKPVPLSGWW
jgi:hypothetical protein